MRSPRQISENRVTNNRALEEDEDASEAIIRLAKETQDLAKKEKEQFSCILKRWHCSAAQIAALTLHNCYGYKLKQYLHGVLILTKDVIRALETAGKLENVLIQIAIEDSRGSGTTDGTTFKEIDLYEVDLSIIKLMKTWIAARLSDIKEFLDNCKETEPWYPKSKLEPYAQSAMEIMKLATEAVEEFSEMIVGRVCDDLVQGLAYGLQVLLLDYTSFASACGSKQSYRPPLPNLTRCNQHSKIFRIFLKLNVFRTSHQSSSKDTLTDDQRPQPNTSHGTQRLFIRLNTLYYLLTYIQSLDKSFSLFSQSRSTSNSNLHTPGGSTPLPSITPSYFQVILSSIQTSIQQISEVAASRLIFLDSYSVFYDSLYVDDVANARIHPTLQMLKQNLLLMVAFLVDQAQQLAMKAVVKASFEAFLMVLLAGGTSRAFTQADYKMVEEDFYSLKHVFYLCGDELVVKEQIEREANVVHGVIALMSRSTEQLVEDFKKTACFLIENGPTKGKGRGAPIPPEIGRWNQSEPNTILRVLCHRNDSIANDFLKKTFHLPKRR